MKENLYSETNELAERMAYLIAGYINRTLTEKEHDELDIWVNESDNNMKLFEDLTDENNIKANLKWMDEINSRAAYERLNKEGKFAFMPRKSNSAFWWIAASLLLIVGGYFIYSNVLKRTNNKNHLEGSEIAGTNEQPLRGVQLTLEDGTIIDLSKVQNGLIANGNATMENDSMIYYGGSGTVQNHILTTPVGKVFQLKLPDGSNVWLNASSSLKYPTAFTGNERIVSITGEGYFEVAKNAKKPFKVVMQDSSVITVLGTDFNVNAYGNEKKVTLVEGSVRVSKAGQDVKLLPGMQVKVSGDKPGKPAKADIAAITAWTKGLFIFKDADIKEIMTELEQWYQIKTVYKGNVYHQFNAVFSRTENLSQLLKLLELNGNVHFKTENNIVYVHP